MSSEFSAQAAAVGEAMQAYQASVADFDREVARALSVNDTDLRCLEILIQNETGVSPRTLADRLRLTTGSVTSMLDRLEGMGYITRSPHPTDRRKLVVNATAAATSRAWEIIGPLVAEGEKDLVTRYSTEQLQVLTDFLKRATELQESHTRRLTQTTRGASDGVPDSTAGDALGE